VLHLVAELRPLGRASKNETPQEEVVMKPIFVSLFLLLSAGGCNKPTEVNVQQAILEGSLSYFQAPPAIGGETDPSGYIIANPKWISGEPNYAYARVYVSNGEPIVYQSEQVRVTGTIDSIFAGGIETPRRKFPLVKISSINAVHGLTPSLKPTELNEHEIHG